MKTEIVKRLDGKFNVWTQHPLSWYDSDFEDWLWESDNGHNPLISLVCSVPCVYLRNGVELPIYDRM